MNTAAWEIVTSATETWAEKAAEALRKAARAHGVPHFTAEDLRTCCAGEVATPYDDRAWGTAVRMAKARGYLVATGGFAFAASSHGSPKPLYRIGPLA